MRLFRLLLAVLGIVFSTAAACNAAAGSALTVTRATLANGLQVVVVHDPLAPVATAMLNYKVGSNDQQYDGQAHALEHMMFRGSATLSESQLADLSELLGGYDNADTQDEVTQYFFTAPSQYLDLVLRMEASRMRAADLSQKDWNIEKGAITQEVTQDLSNPFYRLFDKVTNALFAGTPYGKNGLGTVNGFQHVISSTNLKQFYNTWYYPNNAVYVITGDVDGPATIAQVKKYFGGFKAGKLPARPAVHLRPVKASASTIDSDQPYSVVSVSFRFPGWDSKDYAAGQVLQSVLNNQRGNLYGLVADGKLLYAGLQDLESHSQASGTALFGIIPVTAKPADALAAMRAVLDDYKKNGVPAELVDVAKRRAVAGAEFKANSIQDLAQAWSDAVAVRGESSPDAFLEKIKAVSVDDVNRALRTYIDFDHAIVINAVPKNLGKINSNPPPVAQENNKITLVHHDPLPAWAIAAFKHVSVPRETLHPVDMTLSNGMRLIVVPQHVSHTVVVSGSIASNEAIQAPKGVLGVGDITAGLLPFGTTTYNRLAFRTQLDDIAAEVSAGTDFGLTALSDQFDRAVALLADEQLHPAFPATNFATVKQQEVDSLKGVMTSPDHLKDVALNKALYPPTDPMQLFATPQTAGAVTLDTVKTWYGNAYRPDMATVVVIGDVTPDQAKATFEKYFAGWTATGTKPNVFLPAVPNNKPADIQVPDAGRVQSDVTLAQANALTRANPDWATLAVANASLGAGGSSILFHDVRDVHGLVYGIQSSFDARKNRGNFGISFASDPDKVVPAQRLALADLRNMMKTGASADDLARGKAMLVSQIPLRQQSFDGIARQLINFAQLELPLNQYTLDAQREIATTNTALIAAMQKWVRPGDFVRVIQGPGPK